MTGFFSVQSALANRLVVRISGSRITESPTIREARHENAPSRSRLRRAGVAAAVRRWNGAVSTQGVARAAVRVADRGGAVGLNRVAGLPLFAPSARPLRG